MSKYFKPSEFLRCTPACLENQMDATFLSTLDRVREMAGIPMVLTSAYRSAEHERKMGRDGKSAHTKGKAVDIRCTTGSARFAITRAALACGVPRIGIGKNYIHLDIDETLPQGVIWHYYN